MDGRLHINPVAKAIGGTWDVALSAAGIDAPHRLRPWRCWTVDALRPPPALSF